MAISPLDSTLYSGLFGDSETASHLSDEAELKAMVEVEIGLARVQARHGLIATEAAKVVENTLSGIELDPKDFLLATTSAGVPVPGLVAKLREISGGSAADSLHFGATSQDIADTGLMLRLKRIIGLFEHRLNSLVGDISALAREHRATPMAARTRGQMATPVSFGLRAATWVRDLARELRALRKLAENGLFLQLGGASGDLAAMSKDRDLLRKIEADLAGDLGLRSSAPWMTGRAPLLDIATRFAAITNTTGKIGADVLIGTRSEIGEFDLAESGGSSTMPQKKNPVKAEVLVALARLNASHLGALAATGIHAEERDGASWMGEWLTLPQVAAATGASLLRAQELISGLRPEAARMKAAIDASNGLMLAEAASFALMEHMPRSEAQALVKKAANSVRSSGKHLLDEIRSLTDAKVDWDALRKSVESADAAADMTDRLLEEVAELIA
ncbi:3-carboxy-cis,cis-muconate cycloisomerase [Rhizobiales bacterium]|uniref:lyase family protein n=1 Tax=Hongsoonwoonella zoysiae TaxID=2821844 RepID=UPI0015608C9E|nr:lyase family protein [Hongsoonwoonella zoysiae]NRG16675.1 3-carboxy-cis,cis-muconate cycloisomerase [Hongsoonwoonella zoysiae]